jgi:hypothetical protein
MTQLQHLKIFFIAFIIISGFSNPIQAQGKKKNKNNDTIVIYETVVVYDTLNVYDTLRITTKKREQDLKPLVAKTPNIIDLSNDKLKSVQITEKNNSTKTATFSKNDINKSETKKDSNKANMDNFFEKLEYTKLKGVKFGIVAGGGMWNAREIGHSINSSLLPIYNLGLAIEKPLKGRFSARLELNYSYIYNDMFMDIFDSEQCTIDGTSDSIFAFRQFSVPVKVLYSLKWLQPYVGVSYSFKAQNFSGEKDHALNFCLGASILFSDRFAFGINYTSGITYEFQMEGTYSDFWGTKSTSYSGGGKSRTVDLSLYYFLNGKKRQRIKNNSEEN